MPLTAQCRRLLDRFEELGVLPYDRMSVLQARESVTAGKRLQGSPEDVEQVEDLLVPGQVGRIPARVYHPVGGAPLALVVYLHGGGWVTGSVDIADAPCRSLANATRCVVASVEYRLAPETPHPGPGEDCAAAVAWLAGHAGRWGVPPGRTVVCGDSAGGGLAAAVTLRARDRGGPPIAGQVLMYPALAPARGSRSASYRDNAEGFGLTRGGMEWFWDHYLARPEDGADPYAAPGRAADLTGLPPTLLVTAEYDVLRDEGIDYATRLRDAGVPVTAVHYDGLIHGFFWMAKVVDEARDLPDRIARWLHATLTEPVNAGVD